MKYAHYDEINGKLLGWYDSEIHTTIPTPNIEVSDRDWQIAIDNNYNFVDTTTTTNALAFKDFRTFTELQTAKSKELKQAYNDAIQADIDYMNTSFQADKDSQDMITKVLTASGGTLPSDFFWVDSANNQITMTYTDLQGLAGAILMRNQAEFARYQQLKAAVNAATTVSDLEAIVW